jgi:DNA polymerase-3 subunit delta'
LLLAERPDRLLSTIRSRCQRVRFGPLPVEVTDRILEGASVPSEARKAAVALADGRADRALELASEAKAEQMVELARRIHAATVQNRLDVLLDLSEELAKRDDLPLILETLTRLYRDLSAKLLGCLEQQRFGFDLGEYESQGSNKAMSARSAAQRVSLIQRAADAIERNANRQITLDALLFELAGS